MRIFYVLFLTTIFACGCKGSPRNTETHTSMNYVRIVLPLFIGTLIYSILGFTAGPKGQWPYSQLEQEHVRLQKNLDALRETNASLEIRLANLSSDPDTIAVYAHELGYVHEGEQLIKLAGFNGGIDRNLVAGSPVMSQKPHVVPEWICKLVGVLSGFLAFFGFDALFRTHRTLANKKNRKLRRTETSLQP